MPTRLHGVYSVVTATTAALAAATADATITVPAGMKYIFDYCTVAVDVTNNKVRLYNAGKLFWEELANVTIEVPVDLATRYVRNLQVKEAETIVAQIETTEAVAKTITFKIWLIEAD